MKDLYRKPQAWIFLVTGADVIALSGEGGGYGPDTDDPDPEIGSDPWGDDMDW